MAVLNVSASPPQIAGAIRQAAATTGTSFEYLLTTAQIESKLNPGAQAPTSSAGGLYQFIDQTWLATVKNEGAAFGLGRYAQAIVQGPDGRFDVPNPAARTAIMGLRNNPQVSAMMAGAFTRNNASQLAASLGRHRGPGWIGVVGHDVKGAGPTATRPLGINRPVKIGAAESVLSLFDGDHRYVQQAGRAGILHGGEPGLVDELVEPAGRGRRRLRAGVEVRFDLRGGEQVFEAGAGGARRLADRARDLRQDGAHIVDGH